MEKPCILLVINDDVINDNLSEKLREEFPKYQIHCERTVESAISFISSTDLVIAGMLVDMRLAENQRDLEESLKLERKIDELFRQAEEASSPRLEKYYRIKASFGESVMDELLDNMGGMKVIHQAAEILAPVSGSELLTIPTAVSTALPMIPQQIAKLFSRNSAGMFRLFYQPHPDSELIKWFKERLMI